MYVLYLVFCCISPTVFQTEGSSRIKRNQWCSTWMLAAPRAGASPPFFREPARKYCVVPSPLSARMASKKILPSNLQCFRVSDAQSVRVRYTNQTKHAFGLRVAYVYRPILTQIQHPASDPDRDPLWVYIWSKFSPDPDLIHIWSIFDPYLINIWSICSYDPYLIHIWSIFDS